MKKGFIVMALLVVFAVVALPLAYMEINEEKEKIYITEEVVSGNPSAAEGVTLTLDTIIDEHMFWNTSYTVGRGEDATSDFDFDANGFRYERKLIEDINMGTITNFGTSASGNGSNSAVDIYDMHLSKIIGAVADMCPAGEKITEIVNFADYYDSYPISCYVRNDELDVYLNDYDNEAFTELFRIDAYENFRLEVDIEKNEDGGVIHVDCREMDGYGCGYYTAEAYDFGEKGCYYAFECSDENGEVAKLNQNSGIFYMPYEDENRRKTIDVKGVEKVCELPEGMLPGKMFLVEEDNALYMLVADKKEYRLLVYELDGIIPVMTQDISIMEAEGMHFSDMTLEDGGILIKWNDRSFVFVSLLEDEARVWCSDVFAKDTQYALCDFGREHRCMFDGERLVLAVTEDVGKLMTVLTVYSEDGMEYCGTYTHSGTEHELLDYTTRLYVRDQS
ncbi:MAG: hypothetical protein IJW18_05360 [Lachnospiraceae bacterium]|nr:hypothetical protein [Lachnospiraceae bacterium]